MKNKKCPRCQSWKSLAEYYKCASKASGVQTKCKVCTLEMRRIWRQRPESRELVNRLNAAYYARKGKDTRKIRDARPDVAAAHRAGTSRYRTANPEKIAAQIAVKEAIRTGNMKRLPCEVCGEHRSHGHHDDYSNPLAVRWLCPAHHAQRHKELRHG